eukprot:7964198-Pyramimonas_sp.AAC.1
MVIHVTLGILHSPYWRLKVDCHSYARVMQSFICVALTTPLYPSSDSTSSMMAAVNVDLAKAT